MIEIDFKEVNKTAIGIATNNAKKDKEGFINTIDDICYLNTLIIMTHFANIYNDVTDNQREKINAVYKHLKL